MAHDTTGRTTRRRLGVIGGTFDPVHFGHLGIAEEARGQFALETVVFVPAASPPHKGGKTFASAEDRLEMVKLAISGNPHFIASDIEMRRGGPSYTIDTLDEISGMDAEARIYFIVGADSLAELYQWHRAKELVARFDFIIVGRPGDEGPARANSSRATLEGLAGSFGREAAEKLWKGFLQEKPYNISATEIRARVAAGKSIRYLVPHEVERYIVKRGLYA